MRVPLVEEVTQEASSGRETGVGLERTANEYRVEPVECDVETHRWREGCEVPKDRERFRNELRGGGENSGGWGGWLDWEHKERPRECLEVEKAAPSLKGFSLDTSASSSTFNTGASPPRSCLQNHTLALNEYTKRAYWDSSKIGKAAAGACLEDGWISKRRRNGANYPMPVPKPA